jgi:hypothetical protein
MCSAYVYENRACLHDSVYCEEIETRTIAPQHSPCSRSHLPGRGHIVAFVHADLRPSIVVTLHFVNSTSVGPQAGRIARRYPGGCNSCVHATLTQTHADRELYDRIHAAICAMDTHAHARLWGLCVV